MMPLFTQELARSVHTFCEPKVSKQAQPKEGCKTQMKWHADVADLDRGDECIETSLSRRNSWLLEV